jgi:SAM-dependent methyltransferase
MTGETVSLLYFLHRRLPYRAVQAAVFAAGLIDRAKNRNKTNQQIFDSIYRKNTWGSDGSALCSGQGSRGAVLETTAHYVAALVNDAQVTSILDVGSGDFHFGRNVLDRVPEHVRYLGIDVSSAVIDHVKVAHESDRVRFENRDASASRLPAADLAIVRQVFQHLDNVTIQAILTNLAGVSHLILVEHFPPPEKLRSFNRDIATGALTRRYFGSAVDISQPPFRHDFGFVGELFRFDLDIGGQLVGQLYRNSNLPAATPTRPL